MERKIKEKMSSTAEKGTGQKKMVVLIYKPVRNNYRYLIDFHLNVFLTLLRTIRLFWDRDQCKANSPQFPWLSGLLTYSGLM